MMELEWDTVELVESAKLTFENCRKLKTKEN
jgi:hypothetical protein